MLVAILKVCIFLCVLIIPLRGPSRRKEPAESQVIQSKDHSKYGVNENGNLEVLDLEDRSER